MPADSAVRRCCRIVPGVIWYRWRRSSCLRDELLGLWRPQDLAPATARRPGRCPLHRRAADARSRPCRGDQGQAGEDHGQRQGSGVPARQGQPAVPGARAQSSVGGGLHLCRDLGRVRPCGLRDRCLRTPDRRMAGAIDEGTEFPRVDVAHWAASLLISAETRSLRRLPGHRESVLVEGNPPRRVCERADLPRPNVGLAMAAQSFCRPMTAAIACPTLSAASSTSRFPRWA